MDIIDIMRQARQLWTIRRMNERRNHALHQAVFYPWHILADGMPELIECSSEMEIADELSDGQGIMVWGEPEGLSFYLLFRSLYSSYGAENLSR